jgi:lipopolysaccharide/colanic/teichoic acid biosynthesis glycosyltransferase
MTALRGSLGGNLAALAGALASLTVATFVVARAGGPAGVGDYALLRIMPWLLAVVVSGGLAPAAAYFLAGPSRGDPRVRPTLIAMTAAASAASVLIWLLASPLTQAVFFRDLTTVLVAWASLKAGTRLLVIIAKAASQGTGDLRGSNWIIFLEELIFLPSYCAALLVGVEGGAAIVGSLIASDLIAAAIGWRRLARRGFFAGMGSPSAEVARRIYSFGVRGQVGNLMTVVNLRLDFMIIALFAGPVTLGVYAIASKFAELLRLLPTAFYWVLYPSFARQPSPAEAWRRAAWLLPRAAGATAITAIPLAALAGAILPLVYGRAFTAAVLPGQILLIGLSVEGAAGVVTAYLFGRGWPGLNSMATLGGVVVTVALDVILIPRFGLIGAALASTAAYLVTTTLLLICFLSVRPTSRSAVVEAGVAVPPGWTRRLVDIFFSVVLLVALAPVLLAAWLLARLSTGASGIFRQVRVGQGGIPFTMFKFRSMRPGEAGPEVTVGQDPRITRLGRLLRATNVDELPQLLNILRGDMTLVGPRPETVSLALRYPPELQAVFRHRPGLTGPGQLFTRWSDSLNGAEDVESSYISNEVPVRVRMDFEYLRNPTLWRTLTLVGVTGVKVLRHLAPGHGRHASPGRINAGEPSSPSPTVEGARADARG